MAFARFTVGISLLALCCATAPAHAQAFGSPDADIAVRDYDIAAQPLGDALNAFAQSSGIQFAYSADIVSGRTAQGVKGRFTASEALARLLAGTGLTWRFSNPRTVVLELIPTGEGGERVLGAVRVEGAQGSTSSLAGSSPVNGINGSRDVTATEGTGSYTSNALTIGSKTAATIKDTPASVSVLTSQQMQDQNITDLNSAMRNLPGVSLVNGSGVAGQFDFYSRGFQVRQVQFDGGAAMNLNPGNEGSITGFNRLLDLSLYDHVEIVRGASGTFTGYGDPGGVINLVRKKPLDHTQLIAELQAGSWDWYRGTLDLTGPIALNGALRARLIGAHQDNAYFYDIAHSNRNTVSATIEYDLTPTTLVTIGIDYLDSHELPFRNGLMRYDNGMPLGLPRSTCFCFNFAHDDTTNLSMFGQFEQRIGSDWHLKFKGTRIRQERNAIFPFVSGAVNPYTGQGPTASPDRNTYYRTRQTMLEVTLDGKVRLFGQDQKVVLGANYSMYDPSGTRGGRTYDLYTFEPYNFAGKTDFSVDVFNFQPNEWREPVFPSGYDYETISGDYRFLNLYANVELTPVKRLHISTGIRYAGYRNRGISRNLCNAFWIVQLPQQCQTVGQLAYFGQGVLNKGSDISWPPSIQARYDLTRNLTISAVYTDIYVDQSYALTRDLKPLPPVTGQNLEGELKWASPNRKVNATLSGYYIRQKGFAQPDCDIPGAPACSSQNGQAGIGQLSLQASCCYKFDAGRKNVSYGADLEIAGEIKKGWQLSASYSFNYSYKNYENLYNGIATPLVSYAPRHKAQIWTTYQLGESSIIPGLVVGMGAQAQSKTFVVDFFCTNYVVDPSTGQPQCQAGKLVTITDPGRIIFSGSLGYKITDHFRLDVQLENLLDKTYFEQPGGVQGGGWYGTPRSFKATLRAKF